MKTIRIPLLAAVIAALSFATLAAQPQAAAGTAAEAIYKERTLAWMPKFAHRSATLRIVGPEGFLHEQDFGRGIPAFDLGSRPGMADGLYRYEVVLGRVPDAELARALDAVQSEDGTMADSAMQARARALGEVVSGTFRVDGGRILSPDLVEPPSSAPAAKAVGPGSITAAPKDQVIPDDLIVQGSLCVGFDCVNGESFGFDTIRLKENNTRIKFEDTSAAGFPGTDWQLTANDSASGGANKFSIEDITTARVPFTITGGAATNSIFVDSTGRVGFRTSTPVLDLHVATGNTPALRLEQNASSGFTAQTWDVAGNEANFFVRDVTGGSRLPFRIRPGAPTSSIDISAAGHVGIGTASPNLGGAGRAVTVSSTTAATFAALELQGNQTIDTGVGVVRFYNTSNLLAQIAGARQGADNSGSMRFLTSQAGAITEKMRIMPGGFVGIGTTAPGAKLHVEGNALVNGNLTVTGTCCGPDYVFDPGFQLASIQDHNAYIWKHRHLPAIGPARTTPDGKAVIDVFAQSKGMLEELEKAHIYIGQLHRELETLKAQAATRDAEVKRQIDEMRALLAK